MEFRKISGMVITVLLIIVISNPCHGASVDKVSTQRGYCCAKGKVFPATKAECDRQKGTYYDSKSKADKACRSAKKPTKEKNAAVEPKLKPSSISRQVMGYCCTNGKVVRATKAQCIKQKGTFYSSKSKADRACKSVRGYCCVNGKVVLTTAAECARKNGTFFDSKQEAERACLRGKAGKPGVSKAIRRMPVGPDDRSTSEPVQVTVREAGDTVRPGSTITLRYEIEEPLPGSVSIYLRHHVGGAVTDTRTLHTGAPQTGRDLRFLLPPDIAGEDYRVQVTTRGETTSRSGESAGFNILGLSSTRDELNLSFIGQPSWYMTPVEGEDGSLSYAVRCQGEGCEEQAFQLALMVDGSLVETQTLVAREAAQSLIFWEANCGGTAELVIDPDNLLSETDETDNTWSTTVSCIARPDMEKPDLNIYSASADPWPIAEGQWITFRYSLFNTGRFGEVATGPFNVGLQVGGTIVQAARHLGMAHTSDHSEMVEGSFTWLASCGQPIALVVDTLNEVDEGDETNNVFDGSGGVVPFECVPASLDLMVRLFSVSDDNPEVQAGRTKTYIADIYSVRGDPRNIRVRCGIVGGDVLYDEVLPSLDVMEIDDARRGERISFDTALCPAGETFRLYCEVDPVNSITESDETNNRQEYEMTTVADPSYHCP